MKVKHLGGGVVLIEDLLSQEELSSINFDVVEKTCPSQNYKYIDKKVFLEGGYEVDPIEDIPNIPVRYHENISLLPFYDSINNAMYKGLIEYCTLFPVAAECITNCVKRHFIKYFPGNWMGTHSDSSLAYRENSIEPVSSLALGNTITVSIILNDDFEGGSILFNAWGIDIKPKPGSALYYPSNYIGAHQVNEITSGIRWVFLGFYSHGDEVMFSDPNKNQYEKRYEWTVKLKKDLIESLKANDDNLNSFQKRVPKNKI